MEKNKVISKKLKWFFMIWFLLSCGTPSKLVAVYTIGYKIGNVNDPSPLFIFLPLLIITAWGVFKSKKNIVLFSSGLMILFGIYQLFNGFHHLLYGSGLGAAVFMWGYFTIPSFIFFWLFVKHFKILKDLNFQPNE